MPSDSNSTRYLIIFGSNIKPVFKQVTENFIRGKNKMSAVSSSLSVASDVKGSKTPLVYFASFLAAFLISAVVFYFVQPAFVVKKDSTGKAIRDTMKIVIYSFVIGVGGLALGVFLNARV